MLILASNFLGRKKVLASFLPQMQKKTFAFNAVSKMSAKTWLFAHFQRMSASIYNV